MAEAGFIASRRATGIATGMADRPPSLLERAADTLVLLDGWRRYLTVFLAGAAAALALPPIFAWPVMFAVVPVFLFVLDGAEGDVSKGRLARARPAFATGWWFGFGYFLAGLWWIGSAFLVEAEQFAWALPLAVAGLPAGLALFFGLAAVATRALSGEGASRVLAFATCFAGAEWLRGHVLTGFPWNALGYTAMPTTFLMQPASLWGLYGVTFLALLAFAAPVLLVRSMRGNAWAFATIALMVTGHLVWSHMRLAAMPPETGTERIRIVQPNIAQADKWRSGNEAAILKRLIALSTAETGPDTRGLANIGHVVWPESAFPFLVQQQPQVLAAIADMLPESTRLLTGAMRGEAFLDRQPERVFNSTMVIDHQGTIRETGDKTHLVPFGEYLPFQAVLESLGIRQLTGRQGGFAVGRRRAVMNADRLPFLPLVCYEAIFSGAIFHDPQKRPAFLLNLTNDAWFGHTPGPYQHAHQSRLRAVEEGLPLVRAANNGISMVVDASGTIVASLPLGADGVLDVALPGRTVRTLYSRLGDWPFGLAILLASLALVWRRWRRGAPAGLG